MIQSKFSAVTRGLPLRSSRLYRFLSTMDASENKKVLYDIVPKDDFGQYKEYSVIFTNRSLNLMSDPFQKVMRDLNILLKTTYNASKVAIIPGYVGLKLKPPGIYYLTTFRFLDYFISGS